MPTPSCCCDYQFEFSVGTVPPDTPWTGGATPDTLYLQAQNFLSTILTSQDISSITTVAAGHEWDGADSYFADNTDSSEKLRRVSGQFTTTIKDSEDVSSYFSGGGDVNGIGNDGADSYFCGDIGNDGKMWRISGKFESTIKDSIQLSVGGPRDDNKGITGDGTNTFVSVAAGVSQKLKHVSGKFTSTIKDSLEVSGVDGVLGMSWDGTDTYWCGSTLDKLYRTAGFSSTILDSEDVSATNNFLPGISTNDFTGRLG